MTATANMYGTGHGAGTHCPTNPVITTLIRGAGTSRVALERREVGFCSAIENLKRPVAIHFDCYSVAILNMPSLILDGMPTESMPV